MAGRLPVVPRPEADERLSSWLTRLAGLYAMPVDALLGHLGVGGTTVHDLEWRLPEGEGASIARGTGISPEELQAMTFGNIVPDARMMIAQRNRYRCPLCLSDTREAGVRRKAAAFPWTWRCPIHGASYVTSTGAELESLLGNERLAALDRHAEHGAARLSAWVRGEDDGDERVPAVPAMLDLLTARHRKPSPPSLSEQPRMSLQERRDNHAFLTRPIVRQALTVVVPEYDLVAPVLTKPVRAGLSSLATASLLQAYALAVGIGRLAEDPVDPVVAVLLASDAAGEGRVRTVLRKWPLTSRRCVYARFWRAQRSERDREAALKAARGPQSHKLRFSQSHYFRYAVS
ncbi:MAG: TniQ family protein [Ahrensia sp.]|nr:TniQ family protein [Ahrensia sp.]